MQLLKTINIIILQLLLLLFNLNSQVQAISIENQKPIEKPIEEWQNISEQTIFKMPPLIAWLPQDKDVKAVILCVHGLGLHKACYSYFAKKMASLGIAVYAIDVRGFGDWHLAGNDKLDFSSSLTDIKTSLAYLHKTYPKNKDIFLLGESMGGAIALRFASQYPELLSGVISSVPSQDRFSGLGEDLKVGLHIIAGGLKESFNAGKYVIKHATSNLELQKNWQEDPSCRMNYSPAELIKFQNFMEGNDNAAKELKTLPVLIIQGAQDKLVRPSGTFSVWDHLATPDRTVVVSKSAEHLIFENAQFSEDDISYLCKWIEKIGNTNPDENNLSKDNKLKLDLQNKNNEQVAHINSKKTDKESLTDLGNEIVSTVSGKNNLVSFSYWIELMREGKRYRCNNKTQFCSKDEIRIHITSLSDGYAYILMKQGSTGKHALLFPDLSTGMSNKIVKEKDYALPSAVWLKFDDHPGTEKLSVIFSKYPLDPDTNKYMQETTAIVSADKSGSKDLCPTRMQISWEESNPIILPNSANNIIPASNTSLVNVSLKDNSQAIIAVDLLLEHITK